MCTNNRQNATNKSENMANRETTHKTSNMQILKRLMLIWTTRNSFAFLCYQVNRKFALFLPINRLKFDYGNRFFLVGTPVVLVFIRLGLVDSIESLFISEIRPDYDTNLRWEVNVTTKRIVFFWTIFTFSLLEYETKWRQKLELDKLTKTLNESLTLSTLMGRDPKSMNLLSLKSDLVWLWVIKLWRAKWICWTHCIEFKPLNRYTCLSSRVIQLLWLFWSIRVSRHETLSWGQRTHFRPFSPAFSENVVSGLCHSRFFTFFTFFEHILC